MSISIHAHALWRTDNRTDNPSPLAIQLAMNEFAMDLIVENERLRKDLNKVLLEEQEKSLSPMYQFSQPDFGTPL